MNHAAAAVCLFFQPFSFIFLFRSLFLESFLVCLLPFYRSQLLFTFSFSLSLASFSGTSIFHSQIVESEKGLKVGFKKEIEEKVDVAC